MAVLTGSPFLLISSLGLNRILRRINPTNSNGRGPRQSFIYTAYQIAVGRVKLGAMIWPDLLHLVGYSVGLLGIALLIWSLLKQGVSLIGLVLLMAGFLLLVIAGLMG